MRGSIMKRPEVLSLETVLDEPVPFEATLEIPLSAIDREPLVGLSPIDLRGEARRIEGGYALDARVGYSGQLECSRCLAPYAFSEDEPFTLLLYPSSKRPSDEVELSPGDLDVLYYDDPVLPLSPIAEERIQMALPMKPLCRPDCRGLCPHCGKDLNSLDGPCACAPEKVDPRWDALKALREKA
jgi:uncharacterized protein